MIVNNDVSPIDESQDYSHYPYKWSFNISIEPTCIMEIVIWIGDRQFIWCVKYPFFIKKGYWGSKDYEQEQTP